MTDPTPATRRLEQMGHAKHDLTATQQHAFTHYLIGTLALSTGDTQWADACRAARDLALFEAARAAAVGHR